MDFHIYFPVWFPIRQSVLDDVTLSQDDSILGMYFGNETIEFFTDEDLAGRYADYLNETSAEKIAVSRVINKPTFIEVIRRTIALTGSKYVRIDFTPKSASRSIQFDSIQFLLHFRA